MGKATREAFPITGCSGGDPWRTDADRAGAERGESDDDRPTETAADRGQHLIDLKRHRLPVVRQCMPLQLDRSGLHYRPPT